MFDFQNLQNMARSKVISTLTLSSAPQVLHVALIYNDRALFLTGPLTEENISTRLEYVFGSEQDLHDFFKDRLETHHKDNLLWFVVRNLDILSHQQNIMNILEKIKYFSMADVVKSMATQQQYI